MADVHITGLPELLKFMDELPVKIERNIAPGGLRAGIKVVQAQAIANVPVKSGELRRSLEAKNAIGTRSRGGTVTANLKARVFYAKFVEFGTKPHNIAAKKSGWLSFMNIFRKEVAHPGARPHPFMRPALDSQKRAAPIAVAEYFKNRMATKHGIDTSHIMIEGDE